MFRIIGGIAVTDGETAAGYDADAAPFGVARSKNLAITSCAVRFPSHFTTRRYSISTPLFPSTTWRTSISTPFITSTGSKPVTTQGTPLLFRQSTVGIGADNGTDVGRTKIAVDGKFGIRERTSMGTGMVLWAAKTK